MQLIRDTQSHRRPQATALAVGNFDGLHRGHQALVRAVQARSDELLPALMCFEPLPASFFRPDQPVRRILGVRDKLRLCRELGLRQVFMPRFNRAFAAQSPEAFVRDVLVGLAGARHIVVGPDFRFGARAAGDVDLLVRLGLDFGFEVEVIGAVSEDDDKVSSTRVRAAMASGDLALVERLLGRRYAVTGRVLRGRRLGTRLGYPTVNLRPPMPPALTGVFAVRVSGAGLVEHPAVASLGNRPTVDGGAWLLEAHLFDHGDNLYGRHLSVEFVEYLRAEEKFDDLETMKRQMADDARRARAVLTLTPDP